MNSLNTYDPWDLASYDEHASHVVAYNANEFAPISATITRRFTATKTQAQQRAIDSNNCDAIFALNSFTNYHLGE